MSTPQQQAAVYFCCAGPSVAKTAALAESLVEDGLHVIGGDGMQPLCESRASDDPLYEPFMVIVLNGDFLRSRACMTDLTVAVERHQGRQHDQGVDVADAWLLLFIPDEAGEMFSKAERTSTREHWTEKQRGLKAAMEHRPGMRNPRRLSELAEVTAIVEQLRELLDFLVALRRRTSFEERVADFEALSFLVRERVRTLESSTQTAPPDNRRHEIGSILSHETGRKAFVRWMMMEKGSYPSTNAAPVLAAKAEQQRTQQELIDLLYTSGVLFEEMVRDMSDGQLAGAAAVRLMSAYVSLQPRWGATGGMYATVMAESERIRSRVDVRWTGIGAEMVNAFWLLGGLPFDEALRDFFRRVEQEREWKTSRVQDFVRGDTARFVAEVRRRIHEGRSTLDIVQPPFLVMPDTDEAHRLLHRARWMLNGAAHIHRERPTPLSVAFERALHDIDRQTSGGAMSVPEITTAPTEPVRAFGADPKPGFRWLHVSDLHFSAQDSGRREVLSQLIEDAELLAKDRIDAIFVTGDLAWSGQASQLKEARAWLERLAKAVGVSRKRVFAVCGNHDVDRALAKTVENYAAAMHQLTRQDPARELKELPAHVMAALWPKFGAYVEEIGAHFGGPAPSAEQPFYTAKITTSLGPICIVGLNTALSSMDDQDGAKTLALGQKQILDATELTEHALLVVLMHHPCSWLADGDVLEQRLTHRAHLAFCGHLHAAGGELTNQFGREQIWFRAGAAHDAHGTEYSYRIAGLTATELVQYPRVWSPHQRRFVADTMRFRLNGDANRLPEDRLPKELLDWMKRR